MGIGVVKVQLPHSQHKKTNPIIPMAEDHPEIQRYHRFSKKLSTQRKEVTRSFQECCWTFICSASSSTKPENKKGVEEKDAGASTRKLVIIVGVFVKTRKKNRTCQNKKKVSQKEKDKRRETRNS
jgi:hypothetical protein